MRIMTIREICEAALRKIGALSPNETGARAEYLQIAREWLDMVVGHLGAQERFWWLVPDAGEFNLAGGTDSYDLDAILTTAQAPYGVQFPIAVYISEIASENWQEIDIKRRLEFEAIRDRTLAGKPTCVYISREKSPTLFLDRIPEEDDEDTGDSAYRLKVLFQAYPEDMTRAESDRGAEQLRSAWQLYVVSALAAELGDGPIRKLPDGEVQANRQTAERLFRDLEAFDAHEQANEPRRVAFYNG